MTRGRNTPGGFHRGDARPHGRMLASLVGCAGAGLVVGLLLESPSPGAAPQAADTAGVAPSGEPTSNGDAASSRANGGTSRQGTPESGVDRTSRSREGAVAAAGEYATLLSRIFALDPARARAVAADAATNSHRAQLLAAVATQLAPMQKQVAAMRGRTDYRQSVLAVRLDDYQAMPAMAATAPRPAQPAADPIRARASVWTMLNISHTNTSAGQSAGQSGGEEPANAIAAFSTVRVDLLWERGGWRLAGSSETPGPTPLVDGTPATGREFSERLQGFTDWRPA